MDDSIFSSTWSGRVQSDIDELIALLNSARTQPTCSLCDGPHPLENPNRALLCRHHGNFVHIDCCTEKCSLHGAPCRHAIIIHR